MPHETIPVAQNPIPPFQNYNKTQSNKVELDRSMMNHTKTVTPRSTYANGQPKPPAPMTPV